jgi:predicted nucleic acid-binding protein
VTPEDVPEGPLVVDTDVASWLGWSRASGDRFAPLVAGHLLALSFATVAELWYGAEKAAWGERRRRALDDIVRRYVIVPGTEQGRRRAAKRTPSLVLVALQVRAESDIAAV